MSQGKILIKNTLIYAIGSFGSKALNFLLVPLYTIYLSRSELGSYETILSTLLLLAPISTLQIADGAYRWLLEESRLEKQIKILQNALICIVLGTIVSLIICTIIFKLLEVEHTLLIIAMYFSFFMYKSFQQFIRGLGYKKVYSIAGIIYSAVFCGLNIYLLAVQAWKIEALFISQLLASIFCLIYFFIAVNLGRFFLTAYDYSYELSKKLFTYSLPLIPNAVSWWLINSVNIYLIAYFLGQDNNGLYGVSNRLAAILLSINQIFNLAWQDSAILNFNSPDRIRFYSKTFNRFFIFEIIVLIIITIAIKPLVKFIIAPNYFESWQYIPVLLIGVVFSSFSAFYGTAYLCSKNTKGIFTTTLIGGAINILFTLFTIEKLGLYAPALGTTFGFLTIWLLRMWDTRKYFKLKINYPILTLMSIFASIVYFYIYNIL